jgi:2-oxoglutarate ferredoxin oxidoreductase subunit alpha
VLSVREANVVMSVEPKDCDDVHTLNTAVVRIAGDSGDGVQISGDQFGIANALFGSDLTTFPDYPSEVRAPAGSVYGVSAYQIHFGSGAVRTIGDEIDVLVAFNPAALKASLDMLKAGGLIIADRGAFSKRNLLKAGYVGSPLDDDTLGGYRVLDPDISRATMDAVAPAKIAKKDALRCKNFWVLGFLYWLFHRDRKATASWLSKKFAKRTNIAEANILALDAGHAYGETTEASGDMAAYCVGSAEMPPGRYRAVTGSQAIAWGMVAASELAGRKLVLASYPITPASTILHTLAGLKDLGVIAFQAEDEIAAMGAAIGASYAGSIGLTASSGPGLALKTEAIGLAIATELPVVIINVQRAGPSTGMPTKAEQSDLHQAVFGRNGDAMLPVLAARSPGDCFYCAIEATRLAIKYMTPVIILADGFIANAAEPWKIPDLNELEPIESGVYPAESGDIFKRAPDTLARGWVSPGTPGMEHRIGGLESDFITGDVSYNPENHQKMSQTRADKIHNIANDIPDLVVDQGENGGDLAVVGWGLTYGPISRAVSNLRNKGRNIAHIHLRYLFPFAKNQCDLLSGFRHILVPEMNMGQLVTLMKAGDCPPVTGLSKVTGHPFKVGELEQAMEKILEADN